MQTLNQEQRQRVERLVSDRRMTCLQCAPADLVVADHARSYFGGFGLDLWCQNEEAHPQGAGAKESFNLSREEARFIQLLAVSLNCRHRARMKDYSVDLRRKIVEAVQRGMSKAQAACAFGVGISSVKR